MDFAQLSFGDDAPTYTDIELAFSERRYDDAFALRMARIAWAALFGLLADGFELGVFEDAADTYSMVGAALDALDAAAIDLDVVADRDRAAIECLSLIYGLYAEREKSSGPDVGKVAFLSNQLGYSSLEVFRAAGAILKGVESGAARRGWHIEGLRLARDERRRDPEIDATVIADLIAQEVEGARQRKPNTIEKQIRAWEESGYLTRKTSRGSAPR